MFFFGGGFQRWSHDRRRFKQTWSSNLKQSRSEGCDAGTRTWRSWGQEASSTPAVWHQHTGLPCLISCNIVGDWQSKPTNQLFGHKWVWIFWFRSKRNIAQRFSSPQRGVAPRLLGWAVSPGAFDLAVCDLARLFSASAKKERKKEGRRRGRDRGRVRGIEGGREGGNKKIQRSCGCCRLLPSRLAPLLTTVTWGHTWTDRLGPSPPTLGLLWHTHTHTLEWGPFTVALRWRHPLLFSKVHNHHSRGKNPHSPRPVCSGTLHQRTHTQTHTVWGPPAAPSVAPSIWLVPFVGQVLWAADRKPLGAAGAGRPHDGAACPNLLQTCVTTRDRVFNHCRRVAPDECRHGLGSVCAWTTGDESEKAGLRECCCSGKE